MIQDGSKLEAGARELRADVAILGGGTVGLFLAHLLAQRNMDVLVLEAGPASASPPVNSVRSAIKGKPHNGVDIGRASGVGGTSALWGGQLVEFEPADLTRPGLHWPISYEDLRSAYAHTYVALGLTPPPSTAAFQAALNLQVNCDPGIEQFFTTWLQQPNFAILFGDTVRSEKVRIVTGVTGYDLVSDDDGLTTTLLAIDSAGIPVRAKANRVVLAAGTLGNSQFVQNAMLHGPKPWTSSVTPGAAFHDHIGCRMADLVIEDQRRFRDFFENAVCLGHKVQPKLRCTEAMAKTMAIGVCGFFSFDSSVSHQLAQMKMLLKKLLSGEGGVNVVSVLRNSGSMARLMTPIVIRYLKDKRIMAPYDMGVGFNIQAEQLPIARSRIRLIDGAFQPGRLAPAELDWHVDGRELSDLRRFACATEQFLQAQGIGKLSYKPGLMDDDRSLMTALTDSYHMCGGLAMGTAPASSFTDANGQVWGTGNLYVAGPSVLPTSSYANSTLTALALTWRLAQFLAAGAQASQ